MKITGNGKRALLISGNKRCGITIHCGPWITGVNPDLIKIRPKRYSFPVEFRAAMVIENNSDMMTDYFERDCVRLFPGHPLYQAAKDASTGA